MLLNTSMSANFPCSHFHINAEVSIVIKSLRNLSIYIGMLHLPIHHQNPCQKKRPSSAVLKAANPRTSRNFHCCISILPTRSQVKKLLLARELYLSHHKL